MYAIFAHADNLRHLSTRKRSRLAILLFITRDKTQNRHRNHGNVIPARTAMTCHGTASFTKDASAVSSSKQNATYTYIHIRIDKSLTSFSANPPKGMSRMIGDPSPHRQLKTAQHSPSLCERRLRALKRRNAPTIAGHFYTSLVSARQPAALWLHAAHNSHRAYDAALRRWLRRGPLSDRGPRRSQVSQPGLGAKRMISADSLPREQDLRDQHMSER